MKPGLFQYAIIALVLTFGAACMSTASYHTAQPIEPGTSQVGVAMEAEFYRIEGETARLIAHPRVNGRYGIDEQLDIGVTAGHFGTSGDINFMVHGDDAVAVSLNPRVGVSNMMISEGSDSERETSVSLVAGLLFDIAMGDAMTMTLGAKPGYIRVTESFGGGSQSESDTFIAGSVGMKIDLDESSHLFPEVNVVRFSEDGESMLQITAGIGLGF